MKQFLTSTGLSLIALLAGCEKPEPVTYTIPKEERFVTMPGGKAAAPPAPEPERMQVLPGMQEAAEAAPELTYTVPDGWKEFPAQSVRKANFRVMDGSGQAEITVTVFPGDVGGTLANVNRWRSQIGVSPVRAEDLPSISRRLTISGKDGLLVDLQGPEQGILGGILQFGASTWFFKMQGSKGTVAGQGEAMEVFLKSVKILEESE